MHKMNSVSKRAFTLIELMVVITIILVLAGMTLGGLSVLKNRQHRYITSNLMANLGTAVSTYIDRFGVFGDTGPGDFRSMPYQYLVTRMDKTTTGSGIDIPMKNLLQFKIPDIVLPETPREATHITDDWGQLNDNIFNWSILERINGGKRYVAALEIRSSAGTPGKPQDDIIYRYFPHLETDIRVNGEVIFNASDSGKWVFANKIYGDWIDPLAFENNKLDSMDLELSLKGQ